MEWRFCLILCFLMIISQSACNGAEDDTDNDSSTNEDGDSETASEGDDDTSSEDTELHGACPAEAYLGGLEVSVATDYSTISGAIADGVNPASIPQLEEKDGDCALWIKQNPNCVPSCGSGSTCDFDGTCIPYPVQQDAGEITFTGLSEPVTLEPLSPTNSYSRVDIAHPAFEPGEPIEMFTTDGYFGELKLHGFGVDPLVDAELEWTIVSGEPLRITWTAPTTETRSRIYLSLNIDQHGNSPLTLSCEVPDTGEVTISSALVDALIHSGVSGKPSGRITRRTVDSVMVDDGCIEFRVSSSLKTDVELSDIEN
jgi:hypothetical protein